MYSADIPNVRARGKQNPNLEISKLLQDRMYVAIGFGGAGSTYLQGKNTTLDSSSPLAVPVVLWTPFYQPRACMTTGIHVHWLPYLSPHVPSKAPPATEL